MGPVEPLGLESLRESDEDHCRGSSSRRLDRLVQQLSGGIPVLAAPGDEGDLRAGPGASVTFITSLGNDMYADILKKQFEKEGIITDYIVDDECHPTGTALIFVADSGENCIAVAPGANYSLLPDAVIRFEKVIDEADMIVMQAEIPYETVKKVALLANERGKKVLLNPAPACPIDRELMNSVDLLVVNEVEASFISDMSYTGDNLDEIATALMESGARNVIITLGSCGVYMKNKKETVRISGYKVNAVDTTAAGDTFCGALAVACSQRGLDREALEFANVAAAIAVTRMGAQPSIPTLEEVGRFRLEREISLSFNL